MPYEENSKKIVNLSLVPIGSFVKSRDARDRRSLIGIGFYSDSRVMPDAEEIVYNLKPVAFSWVIDGCDIGHHRVFSGCMVFEKGHDWNDTCRRNINCEFVLPY